MRSIIKYRIPANSRFTGKRLRINAPLSTIVNHASSMKVVKITEVANWTEYGKGNSFAVVDTEAKIENGTGAVVDKLYFQADNGKVELDVKGDVKKTGFYGEKMDAAVTISQGTTEEFRVAVESSKVNLTVEKKAEVNTVTIVKEADVALNVNDGVEKVVVDAAANVTITGDSEKVKEVAVEVSTKAEGAKVASDVPVKAEVKNETKEDMTISTEGSTETETVETTKRDDSTEGTTEGNTGSGTIIVDPGSGVTSPPPTPPSNPIKITGITVSAEGVPSGDGYVVDLSNKADLEDTIPVTITLAGVTKGAITVSTSEKGEPQIADDASGNSCTITVSFLCIVWKYPKL